MSILPSNGRDRRKLTLHRGNNHGPPFLRDISARLSKRLTPWQTLVITLLWLYGSRNFAKVVGLESPEPLANLYTRSYFRATWVITALDAGFWTAMRIRTKWLRDLASILFTIYYLIAAEQADEKVRKVRGLLTVDHLRNSWNKSMTPYLYHFGNIMRPKFTKYPPRAVRIARPEESSYMEPVKAWLYFDGPLSDLKNHDKIVLDVPGGGFVAMSPRHYDDKLLAWAGKTGLPVLSIDYGKAPEFPYPYALNECYDVYHTLVSTAGQCIGLSGEVVPRVVLTGDSAGANYVAGMTLMILQANEDNGNRWGNHESLPVPEALILIYPALDMNIGNWMTDEQMNLIQDRGMRDTNQRVLRRKSQDYYRLRPDTPHVSDDEDEESTTLKRGSHKPSDNLSQQSGDTPQSPAASKLSRSHPSTLSQKASELASGKPRIMKTRLAMSSMISYFNDRVLTPEMMRAMIILYVGPYNRPDFSTDYLLSPLLAPEALLAKFPKTYFLTGERDPLVDDTVIFAGRLRQTKHQVFDQRKEMGLSPSNARFNEKDHVELVLLPGVSHGFLQFTSVYSDGWKHIFRCARWIKEIFDTSNAVQESIPPTPTLRRHHRRMPTESSGDEDRPLEMGSLGTVASENGNANTKQRITRRRPMTQRQKSLMSLASEEDLLGRRMQGVAGGLMGEETPDNPNKV